MNIISDTRIVSLATIESNPWQPRKNFRETELEDLASSIKQHGIVQPLVVSAAANGRYRLIAGERRLRAAKLAGLKEVPVVVRTATEEEALELALVENIQREDLNAIERARAYEQLIKRFKLTQEQAAKRLGKSRAVVANALRLLTLPEVIQRAVTEGRLSEGHAKIIVGLETKELQMKLFERVVATGASVRETEEAARKVQRKPKIHARAGSGSVGETGEYRRLLEGVLSTKVEIIEQRGRGKISIEFYSGEELEEIVRKILGK